MLSKIIKYRVFLLTLSVFLFASTSAKADIEEFISILQKQETLIEKSVVCYRVWSINAAIFELGLKDDLRNDSPRVKKSANALMQTYSRSLFLEKVAVKYNLKELMDLGYEAGAGMNSRGNDYIHENCTVNVNKLMNEPEYSILKEESYKQSQNFVQEIFHEVQESYKRNKSQANLSENQKLILRQVMSVGGQITKEMHEEFWAGAPKNVDGEWDLIFTWLLENLKLAQIYQRELWQSALLSYEQQKIIRTPELQKISKKMKKHSTANLSFEEGTQDYKSFIEAYKLESQTSVENAARLLQAAANRENLESVQGEIVEINDVGIRVILDGMDAGFERVEKLMSPEWQ